jgi:hypothetical protein
MNNSDLTSRQQIKTLLIVIFSGVLCAFVFALAILGYYDFSGRYLVKNALLESSLLTTLSYNDTNSKTGGLTRFIYDGIELSYYDPQTKQQRKSAVRQDQYAQLYQMIAEDKSLSSPATEALDAFQKGIPATLSIKVRTESHAAWIDTTKAFQRIDFANGGGYFRIELHEENAANHLVYFYHPGIYSQLLQLVTLYPP